MSLALTRQELSFQRRARTFAERHLKPIAAKIEADEYFPQDFLHESLQAQGGLGYTKDLPIERYFRDARFMMIGGDQGDHEVHHSKSGLQGNGLTFLMLPLAFA